ncbi:diguanylate cyclase [Paenalcaligenes niemegkensis]|uniref:GGDEF domain-containing protein n=1 Tax=Paenalcaligenes niemegkensis TaxID=2895469 RepID=UPI001EE8CBCD|nr:GGDEF domain-containing protein [Paenalcaligenes niemegkensis]MCQ9617512.1 diguanylate cyclase [Paenalcaligenes niemegkensis]
MRFPRFSAVPGWAAAFIAFVSADLIFGSSLFISLALATANIIGIAVGWYGFKRIRNTDLRLGEPSSVLSFFIICTAASAVCALAGSWTSNLLYGRDLSSSWIVWFTSELVNYVIVLPLFLTPQPRFFPQLIQQFSVVLDRPLRWWLPLFALLASVGLAWFDGGPGAIVFPMPALIWCALSYSVALTAYLICFVALGKLSLAGSQILPFPDLSDFLDANSSIRLGVALFGLVTLVVASLNASKNDKLTQLERVANLDYLTGVLGRSAFLKQGRTQLELCQQSGTSVSVIMLDIDYFKKVNDQYGHAAGDAVLLSFASEMSKQLRTSDAFGRLGGEEFAIIMCGLTASELMAVAERLRCCVERLEITVGDGLSIKVTTSVGLSHSVKANGIKLGELMTEADKALYVAKSGGRNRVAYMPSLPVQPASSQA